jgi:DNA-binding LytR/AlgR family response regulator
MKIDYMIIEDEFFSSERLRKMVAELRPSYNLVCRAESVEESVAWLKERRADLIFMDVELADHNCFEIFSRVEVKTPVIFTTAYNEYAIRAFKVNSIDYLLKPYEEHELAAAIDKFETLHHRPSAPPFDYGRLESLVAGFAAKNRMVIGLGNSFITVEMADVSHFFSEDKYTYLHTFAGKSHIINESLGQMETQLSRKQFFRASRNYIVNIKAIGGVHKHFNGRLKLNLNTKPPVEIIISAQRRDELLAWLGGDII